MIYGLQNFQNMKVLFCSMKVCHCNFATSRPTKKHIEMKKIISLILVMIAVTIPVIAQESTSSSSTMTVQATTEKSPIPLYLEASLGVSTPYKGVLPFEQTLDVNYAIKRFSIHALCSSNFILPKDGETKDYNRTVNLGGGVGFELFPRDINDRNILEARATVTTSLGCNNFKNTSYRIGINWYTHGSTKRLSPIIGVGYNVKTFANSNTHTYHGMYLSFGVRF